MIGLLPAAGEASRMNGLAKWLLPIPGGFLLKRHIDLILAFDWETPIFIGTNPSSRHFLEGCEIRASVYMPDDYRTMSQTVLGIRSPNTWVLFGMPDTYLEDDQAYNKLAAALNAGADLAVGLFYTRPEQRSSLGMCQLVDERITDVIDKPDNPHRAAWAWGVLGWRPAFWEHIKPEDPHVGYAIPRAIAAGLDVRAVKMDGGYWDCGTPDEYFMLIHTLMSPKWPEPR